MPQLFRVLSNFILNEKKREMREDDQQRIIFWLLQAVLCKHFVASEVLAVSLHFGLVSLTPLAIKSQVCPVLQWAEGLLSFYFGGLKLITDCGLYL